MSGIALKLIQVTLGSFVTAGKLIGQVMIGLMSTIVVVGVIARYFFNAPLAFSDEYIGYLMVGIAVIGANWVLRDGGHVRVDIVLRQLPPTIRVWLIAVTDVITVFCVAFVFIQFYLLTSQTFQSGTISNTVLRTPIGAVQVMMPIGFGLLLIELLRITTISIRCAISQPKSES